MVGLTSQINNWLLNPQSSPYSAEKVRKQSQECPLMANEKKMTSFSIVTSCICSWDLPKHTQDLGVPS